jgi:hypothetical protein
MSLCLYVSMSLCLYVSMSLCLYVSTSLRLYVSMSLLAEGKGGLRRFLTPLTPEVRHRDVFDLLTPGTGQWFLDSEAFQAWLTSDGTNSNVLCCLGDPGAGKTGLGYVISVKVFTRH